MSSQYLETFPICEKCWLDENTYWEPEGVDEDGMIISKLTKIALPGDLELGKVQTCCMCADITVVGLYVERDPETVPYPAEEIEFIPLDDEFDEESL